MATELKTIFVIGGTGAQGIPIVEALAKDGKYDLRVLTRDTSSKRAQQLAHLPHVELLAGRLDDDETLRKGFAGCWGAFINLDGFIIGQKNELFWGVRSYQLAQEAGLKFYIWGNLDYLTREANYNPKFRCGHYDAKGIVSDFILSQNRWHAERRRNDPDRDTTQMGAAAFTTGPYIDMVLASGTVMTPRVAEDGVVEWRAPLKGGAVAHVALDDCGKYVLWMFDHAFDAQDQPGRSFGMDLAVAIEHVYYDDLAKAFEKVTGRPARFVETPEEQYFQAFGKLGQVKIGQEYGKYKDDDGSLLTWEQNFTGFWRMWQASGGEKPLIRRDYALMDEIVPDRIRTAEAWFSKHKDLCEAVFEGKMVPILRLSEGNGDFSARKSEGSKM